MLRQLNLKRVEHWRELMNESFGCVKLPVRGTDMEKSNLSFPNVFPIRELHCESVTGYVWRRVALYSSLAFHWLTLEWNEHAPNFGIHSPDTGCSYVKIKGIRFGSPKLNQTSHLARGKSSYVFQNSFKWPFYREWQWPSCIVTVTCSLTFTIFFTIQKMNNVFRDV